MPELDDQSECCACYSVSKFRREYTEGSLQTRVHPNSAQISATASTAPSLIGAARPLRDSGATMLMRAAPGSTRSNIRPAVPVSTPTIGAKLEINTPGDESEREANATARQVLSGTASTGFTASQNFRSNPSANICSESSSVHGVLRSAGQPLDAATRAFMESRFGHDLGHVRVHTDGRAADSSRSIRALAYSAGNNIAFARDQYAPQSDRGKQLLAHELTHVLQQRGQNQINRVFRFADDDHNVIDEVATTLASISPDGIKKLRIDPDQAEQIHAGNTKRDYSQSPPILNLALLCKPSNFGGYHDYDHFDNFEWNEELEKWQSRTPSTSPSHTDPIEHMENEFDKFVIGLPGKEAFQHVGSAFHTIEDFFAHSNFMDLIHGETKEFGDKLLTGSVPPGDNVSLLKIGASISSDDTAKIYDEKANEEIRKSDATSHPRLAKDYSSNKYHFEAMVLAGLVVKGVATDVLQLQQLKSKEERLKYVHDTIMPKLKRYFRPPNKNDKWWEDLRLEGGAQMEKSIRETRAQRPVTANQCVLSPMRSIEASKDSNMKLYGPTISVPTSKGHVWVQMGAGLVTTPDFKGADGDVAPRNVDTMKFGVQIGGRW